MADKKEQKKAQQAAPKQGKAKGKGDGGEKKAAEKARAPKITGKAELERAYQETVVAELTRQFGYTNRMQVPRLEKIVVNTSLKDALTDIKILEAAASELAAITGQRPVITKAKKSIANFKLRKGQSIGTSVTLRRRMMYEFMSRLVNVALPRVRDFKGVSAKAFDGRGNYTLGLGEQIIFPEINFDKVQKVYGMNITFVTSAKTDEEGWALLTGLGMPFRSA